jgi:hypothetical protein
VASFGQVLPRLFSSHLWPERNFTSDPSSSGHFKSNPVVFHPSPILFFNERLKTLGYRLLQGSGTRRGGHHGVGGRGDVTPEYHAFFGVSQNI